MIEPSKTATAGSSSAVLSKIAPIEHSAFLSPSFRLYPRSRSPAAQIPLLPGARIPRGSKASFTRSFSLIRA